MESTDEKERQRLIQFYAALNEGELVKIAANAGELTEIAVQVLSAELQKRDLPVPLVQSLVSMTEIEQLDLVIVQQFRDLPDALLAQGVLTSAGVQSFLLDDNLVRMEWFISNLIGGIKVAVKSEDEDAAIELLEQPIAEQFEVEGLGVYEQPRCRKCGSLNIEREGRIDKRVALPALWVVSVPIPFRRDTWKCWACGLEWHDESADNNQQDETLRFSQ